MKQFLFSVLLGTVLLAGVAATDYRHSVSIREVGFPIVPALSGVQYRFSQTSPFGLERIYRAGVRTWYLADTPYFFPDPFGEIGLLVEATVFRLGRFDLSAGVGTAISTETDSFDTYSVPMIVAATADVTIVPGLFAVGIDNTGFLYSEGVIYKMELPLSIRMLEEHLQFQLAPGFNYGHSWEDDQSESSFKILAAIGWQWGES